MMIMPKTHPKVMAVEDLNINQLIEWFNRAMVGRPHKRKNRDRDRHYIALRYPPRSPERQGRLTADMLRFFQHRRLPQGINLDRLGWEVLTALGKANEKVALDLAAFLLDRLRQFADLLRWYRFYATARPDQASGRIKQLITERLTATAASEEDKHILEELC